MLQIPTIRRKSRSSGRKQQFRSSRRLSIFPSISFMMCAVVMSVQVGLIVCFYHFENANSGTKEHLVHGIPTAIERKRTKRRGARRVTNPQAVNAIRKSRDTNSLSQTNPRSLHTQKQYHHQSKVQHKLQHTGLAPSSHPHTLYHLHIGKTGGTSLDKIGVKMSKTLGFQYIGHRHFDWTGIGGHGQVIGRDFDVIMLLRDPIRRAISHFEFAKRLRWTKELNMRNQTLQQYLFGGDTQQLLLTRDIWQDGQAGVSWLTGTHIGDWVGCPKSAVERKERMSLNTTAMMHLAAERLQTVKWFGLLEDLNRSMELLQHEFNLDFRPVMKQLNNHTHDASSPVTMRDKEALAVLMPQDLWLYKYAHSLFEARWNAYDRNETIVMPAYPPLPVISCISTRLELNCTEEPFKGKFRLAPTVDNTPNGSRKRRRRPSIYRRPFTSR